MQVKKFEAPSLEVALAMVKREMGPNALILSTEQKKRKWYEKSSVEITAAQEKKVVVPPPEEPEVDLLKVFPHRKYQLNDALAVRKQPLSKYIDVGPRTVAPAPKPKPKPFSNPVYENLKKLGFSEDTAKDVSTRLGYEFSKDELESREFLGKAVGRVLTEHLKIFTFDQFASVNSWMPIGISGAGKTTCVVKLALALRAEKKGVVLVSEDERKVVARTEMAHYARLIRVPFSADSKGARMGKQELIDTPALSFVNVQQNRDVEQMLGDKSSFLVIDASQRLNEMLRVFDLSHRFNPMCVAFTKLDCISEAGVIYEFLKATKLPLLGVSLSQSFKIPFRFFETGELGTFFMADRSSR